MYLMSGSIVYTRIPKPRIIYFFLSLVLSVRFHALFIIRLDTTQKLFKWPYFCLCSTWRQMNKQGKQISHPLSWQQRIQTKHIGSKPAYLKSNFNYKYSQIWLSLKANFIATQWQQFVMTYIRNDISGPLHALWQVSFGCWVAWSISRWHYWVL